MQGIDPLSRGSRGADDREICIGPYLGGTLVVVGITIALAGSAIGAGAALVGLIVYAVAAR
jgi:hypothetical protein